MTPEEFEIEKKPAEIENQELLIDTINEENNHKPWIKYTIIGLSVLLTLMFGINWAINYAPSETQKTVFTFVATFFDKELLHYLLIGILAQTVDGALGMAYGATATAFLTSAGVGAAASSASIHIAEVFTTGASGISHFKLGNVNKKLLYNLLVPGVIGAILGASTLCYLESSGIFSEDDFKTYIKPLTTLYTLILGIMILRKAFAKIIKKRRVRNLRPLAVFGAFMDSVGGGGWGPIVTSTLLSTGRSISYTIGSVNAAEFFVALASSITFFVFVGLDPGLWKIIAGLIIGGVFAAPFAAVLVKKVKRKPIMIFVGCFIIFLSTNTFLKMLFKIDLLKMFAGLFF